MHRLQTLRLSRPFIHWRQRELAELACLGVVHQYQRGKKIIKAGDTIKRFYIMKTGIAIVQKYFDISSATFKQKAILSRNALWGGNYAISRVKEEEAEDKKYNKAMKMGTINAKFKKRKDRLRAGIF